jgi:RimJ/RimL family protein N-acetyltransferase
MQRHRHEYALTLADWGVPPTGVIPAEFVIRVVEPADLSPLAELMLEAYRNTIDYEGEGLTEAIEEVQRYFSPISEDPPLLGHSVLVSTASTLHCACLVKQWHRRQCPLVGYVMCHPAWKRRHLAVLALAESLRRLKEAGFSQVRAVITEGNVASEQLFLRAGFRRLASP